MPANFNWDEFEDAPEQPVAVAPSPTSNTGFDWEQFEDAPSQPEPAAIAPVPPKYRFSPDQRTENIVAGEVAKFSNENIMGPAIRTYNQNMADLQEIGKQREAQERAAREAQQVNEKELEAFINPDLSDVVDPTTGLPYQGRKETWERNKPGEILERTRQEGIVRKEDPLVRWGGNIPFAGAAIRDLHNFQVEQAEARLKSGSNDPYDRFLVGQKFAEEFRKQGRIIPEAALETILDSITFGSEMYMTGGVYGGGRALVEQAAKKVLKESAEKGAAKAATAIAGRTLGVAAQTALSPARIANDYVERVKKYPDEGVLEAAAKAFGQEAIELGSERSGQLLRFIPKVDKLGALKAALIGRFLKKNPGSSIEQVEQVLKQAGWNGLVGEMLEERVGEALRGASGIETYTLPSLEQLAIEGLAFSLPGMGQVALEKALNRGEQPAIPPTAQPPAVLSRPETITGRAAPGELPPQISPPVQELQAPAVEAGGAVAGVEPSVEGATGEQAVAPPTLNLTPDEEERLDEAIKGLTTLPVNAVDGSPIDISRDQEEAKATVADLTQRHQQREQKAVQAAQEVSGKQSEKEQQKQKNDLISAALKGGVEGHQVEADKQALAAKLKNARVEDHPQIIRNHEDEIESRSLEPGQESTVEKDGPKGSKYVVKRTQSGGFVRKWKRTSRWTDDGGQTWNEGVKVGDEFDVDAPHVATADVISTEKHPDTVGMPENQTVSVVDEVLNDHSVSLIRIPKGYVRQGNEWVAPAQEQRSLQIAPTNARVQQARKARNERETQRQAAGEESGAGVSRHGQRQDPRDVTAWAGREIDATSKEIGKHAVPRELLDRLKRPEVFALDYQLSAEGQRLVRRVADISKRAQVIFVKGVSKYMGALIIRVGDRVNILVSAETVTSENVDHELVHLLLTYSDAVNGDQQAKANIAQALLDMVDPNSPAFDAYVRQYLKRAGALPVDLKNMREEVVADFLAGRIPATAFKNPARAERLARVFYGERSPAELTPAPEGGKVNQNEGRPENAPIHGKGPKGLGSLLSGYARSAEEVRTHGEIADVIRRTVDDESLPESEVEKVFRIAAVRLDVPAELDADGNLVSAANFFYRVYKAAADADPKSVIPLKPGEATMLFSPAESGLPEKAGGATGTGMITPEQDARYMELAKEPEKNREELQRMVDERLAKVGAYWHGTASGNLRGGTQGFHVGTKAAATQALEAAIGIPADGRGWDGTREYGKTLLAGRRGIDSGEFGKYRTSGHNADAPLDDYYPEQHPYGLPKHSNGERMRMDYTPWVRPVIIVGEMINTPNTPRTDERANTLMRRQLRKGAAIKGSYYKNEGEDYGSISAVLPTGNAVRVKLPDPITRDDQGNVIPLSQRFNPEKSDLRFSPAEPAPSQSPLGFYSQVEKNLLALPDRFTVGQLKAALRPEKGIKAEEMEWREKNLPAPWEGKADGDKLTKAEVMEWVRDSAVEVEEKVLGRRTDISENLIDFFDKSGQKVPSTPQEWIEKSSHFERVAQQWQKNGDAQKAERFFGLSEDATRASEGISAETGSAEGQPKFSQYQLPGGENYREMLLTLPEKPRPIELPPEKKEFYEKALRDYDAEDPTIRQSYSREGYAARVAGVSLPRSQKFTGSHFAVPNILAHVRFNTRTLPDGRKMLFIEELQSDWHQKGREKGYRGKGGEQAEKDKAVAEMFGDEGGKPEQVPDAPFKKTWPLLALRRIIRYAVDNGFNTIGFTTGEQQAARYDLSKQVKEVRAGRMNTRDGVRYSINVIQNDGTLASMGSYSESELPGMIGKEMASRIVANENNFQQYKGLDLKVGGEGMKGFYDTILVNEANKLLKKYGAKVGDEKLASKGSEPIHAFAIPPQLKVDVMEKGQLLFSPAEAEGEGLEISNKNASVDAYRAEHGRPPLMAEAARDWPTAWNEAMRKIEADPTWVERIIGELDDKPRPITDIENAALDHRRIWLHNEQMKIGDAMAAEQKSDNDLEQSANEAQYQELEKLINKVETVLRYAGSELGRGLNARKMVADENFSLIKMKHDKRVALGRSLTKEEADQVAKDQKELAEFREAEAKRRQEVEDERSNAAFEEKIKLLEEQLKDRPLYHPKVVRFAEEYARFGDKRETEALKRLKANQKPEGGLRFSPADDPSMETSAGGLDPSKLSDLAFVAMANMTRGQTREQWEAAMLEKVGDWIKPHLQEIYVAGEKQIDEDLEKRVSPEIRKQVKGAMRGKLPSEIQAALVGRIERKIKEDGRTSISALAAKLARNFIVQGIKERDKLVDAVHAELKKIIPDFTRRETMDAISGYGKFTPLSKDEIDVTLRGIKGVLQQLAKLEDIRAKRPLQKTGFERPEKTDEERRYIKLVNEAKRKFGVVVTDPARQLKSALDARKTAMRHQIVDLQAQVDSRQKLIKEKTLPPTDQEYEDLKKQRDVLRSQFEAIFGKHELSDAQRLKLAVETAKRSLAAAQQRLKDARKGVFDVEQQKRRRITSDELQAIRADIEATNAEIRHLRNLDEKSGLIALKARLTRMAATYQRRLAEGDFAPKVKKVVKPDPEAQRLQAAFIKAKMAWQRGLFEDKERRKTVGQKIVDVPLKIINTIRALITSGEVSAVLRQGQFIVLSNPIRAFKSIGPMFKAMVSEEAAININEEILNRKNAPLYHMSKLFLHQEGGSVSAMEEAYLKNYAEKVWGLRALVGASQRAYTTFLNKLRADSFDAMLDGLGGDAATPEQAKAVAHFINVATGRGSLGKYESAGVGLSAGFFAPRYVVSRFQLLTGQAMWGQDRAVVKLIAVEYGKYLLGLSVLYALASLMDDDDKDVEVNPLSSDFGKIRFGNTRVDPLAGLAQMIVFFSRMFSGHTKSLKTGRIKGIYGDVPGNQTNAADVIMRFFRTKLSPGGGLIADVFTGTDVIGQPITVAGEAKRLVIPMTWGDVWEAMLEQGVAGGTALGILAFFGMGLQTFDERKKREKPQSAWY